MNTTETKKQSQPSGNQPSSQQKSDSSSKQATEKAKQGEPLNADRPRDRSPKQENL